MELTKPQIIRKIAALKERIACQNRMLNQHPLVWLEDHQLEGINNNIKESEARIADLQKRLLQSVE